MRPWLVVVVDRVRGVAAVRGRDARRVAALVSTVPPRWSEAGRGWLVPASYAEDVRTYGQSQCHEWVLVFDRKQV